MASFEDPVELAVAAQQGGGYIVDSWEPVRLEPMMKLWRGKKGGGCYFLSEEDARDAMGSYVGTAPYKYAERLWRLAQVPAHEVHGYRGGIEEFVVDLPTWAAVGRCLNNPKHGVGGAFQYFVPSWNETMFRTPRDYDFKALSRG